MGGTFQEMKGRKQRLDNSDSNYPEVSKVGVQLDSGEIRVVSNRNATKCIWRIVGRGCFRPSELCKTTPNDSPHLELGFFHRGVRSDHSRGLHQQNQQPRCTLCVQ